MDMRIPPLKVKILPESNPLKSIILVGRLGVRGTKGVPKKGGLNTGQDEGLSV